MKPDNSQPSIPLPKPPKEPGVFDCCGNECGDACVWTIYRLAQEAYELDFERWQIQQLLNEEHT